MIIKQCLIQIFFFSNMLFFNPQLRTAPAPVVGWPPIRSFRRNIAGSSSSKQAAESPNAVLNKGSGEKSPVETSNKGLFVKINMDGVPIGRKVDLRAYDSYEKLSTAVDELFRGLLAGYLFIWSPLSFLYCILLSNSLGSSYDKLHMSRS